MKTQKIFILLGFLLMMGSKITAQERAIVQGCCKDEDGKAIENVSVYAHDSLLVSVTDEQGRFTYSYAQAGLKLRFAHMVFETAYYTIKEKDINGKNLTVRMKTKSHELLEAVVTANVPQIVFDNPVMSILDYTIREDGIYMIVYRRRNSALLHLSFDMDTLHELPISSRYKYRNKDAFGDIYALNDYQASLVGFMELDNGKKMMMNFYHSMSRKSFYDKFAAIVAASDSIFVTGRYFLYNKEMSYYGNTFGSDEEPRLDPWRVTIVDTGYNTMTGGRIKRIQPYIGEEPFFMTYGDGVCDVDINKLLDFHKQSQTKGILSAISTLSESMR